MRSSFLFTILKIHFRFSDDAAVRNFKPVGGQEALQDDIKKHYQGDYTAIVTAQLTYSEFISGTGTFFGTQLAKDTAKSCSIVNFWIVATLSRVEDDGCKLFRMLKSAWIGQGGAEIKTLNICERRREIGNDTVLQRVTCCLNRSTG